MSASAIYAHLPTRDCPPVRTCGMEYHTDVPIPACLPDIGTVVKNSNGTIGVVLFYEYYVNGQTTFPVQFLGRAQTCCMSELVVLDRATLRPAPQRVADMAAARAVKAEEDRARRCEEEKLDAEAGDEISARGVC